MRPECVHRCLVEKLQRQIREAQTPLSLHYSKSNSNTTRSKAYKKGSLSLSCSELNHVLAVDIEQKKVTVEPRVTMEELVCATLPFGFIPSIVPEFKGITVGGAIMGAAAESTSHQKGIFHDSCAQVELLDGKGNLVSASPDKNSDLFYGISGSYGSLGVLVSAEIELVAAQPTVHLKYYSFSEPQKALEKMGQLIGNCQFLDGIIFSKKQAVVIEGDFTSAPPDTKISSKWYAHRVKEIGNQEEKIPLFDYLFRYDQGAFWMGSFLFSPSFLFRYLTEGLLNWRRRIQHFSSMEVERFKNLAFPKALQRFLISPLTHSQRLWALLHKAEKWVQDRLVIQDVCIPIAHSAQFLSTILDDPGLFPIWLCPIKGTQTPQLFAPHQGYPQFLNFGLYGSPSYSAPMSEIIQKLESKTDELKGRKVLYSRSYYTEEGFWQVYSQEGYEHLRKKTHATGVWRGLTEKVLSE